MQLRKLFNYFNQSTEVSSNSSVVTMDAQVSNSSTITADLVSLNASTITTELQASNSSTITTDLASLNASLITTELQASNSTQVRSLNSSALTSVQLFAVGSETVCEMGEGMTQKSVFTVDMNRYMLEVTPKGDCRHIMNLLHEKYNATAADGECERNQTLIDDNTCGDEIFYPNGAEISDYYRLTLTLCGIETLPSRTNELADELHGVCNAAKTDPNTKFGIAMGAAGFLALLVFGSICCVWHNRSKTKANPASTAVAYSALPGEPEQAAATAQTTRRDSLGNGKAGVFGGGRVSPTAAIGAHHPLESDSDEEKETTGLLSGSTYTLKTP